MGFYFEMQRASEREFREGPPPPVFWTLYAILGFALACMSGAAFTVLRDLVAKGGPLDAALYYLFLSTLPLYLLLGVRLLWVHKFILLGEDQVRWGFKLGRKVLFAQSVPRAEVTDVRVVSRVPSPNMAPSIHDDKQYYFQGHWRVVLQLKSGRVVYLDRHNERGALEDLLESLQLWSGVTTA